MKYGALSQSNINSTGNTYFKVASGDTTERPADPKDGMIRYNSDHVVSNVGQNSGTGRFEVYYKGQWTPLITLIDFASPSDIYSTGNVTLKVLADMIKDFFVQGMGLIEVNQGLTWGTAGSHVASTAATAKTDGKAFMPEAEAGTPGGTSLPTGLIQSDTVYPTCINDEDYTGANSPVSTHHINRLVQQTQPIFKPIIGTGRIYEINMTNQGNGYATAELPVVKISTGGGEGARIVLTVEKDSLHADYGKIITATVTEKGTGYHPSYTKTYLKGGGGRGGEIGLVINGAGEIDGVNINNPGELYEVQPTVSLSDGGLGGYAEVAAADIIGGQITKITIVSRGIDYISNDPARKPVVEIISSTGTGAAADIELGDGKVIDVEVLRGGSGYLTTAPPSVIITGDGTGAVYTITGNQIDGGAVTSTSQQSPGTGYSFANATVTSTQTTSNSYIRYTAGQVSVLYKFDLDLMTGCGVPVAKRGDYKIGLFNSLYKAVTRYGHLNVGGYNRDYLQTVKMVPKWDVTAADPYSDVDYGKYECKIFLCGVRHYYAAACGAAWFGSLTKWRNF